MGRACWPKHQQPSKMKVFMLLALAAGQINSQEDGSGHGGMDGSGSGMEGSGSGMGGSGYGMGYGSGYGMGGSGFGSGDWLNWGECCPSKKIWGSMYPEKDGIYDLVIDGYMVMNMMGSGYGMGMGSGMGMGMDMDNMIWPERCSRHCIYKKRDSYDDRMYCFARSQYSQSMCIAKDYDGEKPINVDEFGSGSGYGYGYGMGGSGSEMGSGSGMGSGSTMEPMAEPNA